MQSMVERLPGVAPPIRRSNPDSYADTPFVEEIASVEMPRKFSFPKIKMYDGTGDPDDHIAQYKQRMLAVALPKESHEATMCKGFGSTLIGPALQWYINLPTRSIYSFAGLSDKFVEQFASSRSLEKISDDGGLYKELTMYPCKTMEDVLSPFWAQVKWEEDVASRAKAQPKQDQRSARSDRGDRDKRSSQKGSKDSGSRNRVSTRELVNVLKQMGQQVKWPPKMKAPDSFRNPELWCDFHRNHGHKTEDCIALRIEDPRPPPHIDKITENLIRYQPVVSRIKKRGMSTSRKPPQRVYRTAPEQRAPRKRMMETLSQAGGLRTWSLRWMNETTRFMEVLKTFIKKRQWSPNTKVWGMKQVSTAVPRPKKRQNPAEEGGSSSKDACPKSKSNPADHLATRGKTWPNHRGTSQADILGKRAGSGPRDLRSWPTLNDKWYDHEKTKRLTVHAVTVHADQHVKRVLTLKTFINKRQWSPDTKVWAMKQVSTAVPRPKKEAEPRRRRRNPPARTLVPKASPRDLRSWPTLNDKWYDHEKHKTDVESSKAWHLGFHPHQHLLNLIVAFCKKQHAARELDSDLLPNGRMRYPKRYQKHFLLQEKEAYQVLAQWFRSTAQSTRRELQHLIGFLHRHRQRNSTLSGLCAPLAKFSMST
ncbi:hypothetical protein F2Q69_00023590 [Brassica cretica]|uniref:Retrotransposon gag domain-containing protein n=1 Tax=Brassica cretica TaxID=69181 RepID=A0A8S9Q0D7_BRACR|nr:hypothetical protein F2Q69_00023590 [Brassica cretica]